MLILTRERDEAVVIGENVVVTVVDIRGDKVRLGVHAPPEVAVHREEVFDRIHGTNAGVRVRRAAGGKGGVA